MDNSPKEQKIEKEINQLQNRQKILLNRKRTEEHRARTHRLIGRGAILEGVFPAVVEMEGEEVKAFLITFPVCQGRRRRWIRLRKAGTERKHKSNGALMHRSGAVRPVGGLLRSPSAMGAAAPKPQ